MKLFRVISEGLETRIRRDRDPPDPGEPYAIAHLVIAPTHSQAVWWAWKTDRESFTGDPRDKPKFKVRQLLKDVEGPARIVSGDPKFRRFWDDDPGAADAARLDWLAAHPVVLFTYRDGKAILTMDFLRNGPIIDADSPREAIDRAMAEEERTRIVEEWNASANVGDPSR